MYPLLKLHDDLRNDICIITLVYSLFIEYSALHRIVMNFNNIVVNKHYHLF